MNRSRAARRRENTNRAERYKPDTGSGQHILLQVNKSQQICCAREVYSNRVEISAGSGTPDRIRGRTPNGEQGEHTDAQRRTECRTFPQDAGRGTEKSF